MKPKAYSYIRFSSIRQSKGQSKKRQEDLCQKYCDEHGLDLAREAEYSFFDGGRSAYTGDHVGEKGQLARFLRMVQEGSIERGSYLLVESLDRLSREQVRVALSRFLDLLDAGINIVTLTDPPKVFRHDSTNELDIIIGVVMMSRAHEESSTKAQRVQAVWKAKQAKAREGKPVAKTVPLWLKYEDGQYLPLTDRVATVQRVFQLAIDGYGKGRIAQILNADGIRSFKDGLGEFSGTWGGSSVDKVLNNRAVTGEYQPKSRNGGKGPLEPSGPPIAGYYPIIVPPATFYRARAAIDARRTGKATKQSDNFNVWQGVGRCMLCGSALHLTNKGRPPKGSKYLSCANKHKGKCNASLIRLDHSEQLLPLILAQLDSMSLVKASGGKLTTDLATIDGRLAEQRQLLADYEPMFKARRTDTLYRMIAEAEDTIAELLRQREHVQGELAAEDAIDFDTFMERLDLESRIGRAAANALLKRLDVLVFATREDDENRNASSHYIVSQDGQMRFGVSYVGGKVGYRELSPWRTHRAKPNDALHVAAAKVLKHAQPVHYVTPLQAGAGAFSLEEDLDEARRN